MFGMLNMGIVVTMRDMLSGPAMKVVKACKDIERVSNFGAKLQASGGKLTAMGAVFTGVASEMKSRAFDMAKPLYELEDGLAAVRTIAPATFGSVNADMTELTKAAEGWSTAHTDSSTAFVKASYMMLSSGLDMRQAMAGTSTAMTVAKATMGDGMETASLLATVYANVGDKSKDVTGEMARLGDVVARTQQLFKFPNLGVLTEGLKYGVPVAKQYGMSIEQLSSVIGTLNDAGIEGGQAGTTMSAMMRSMNKASADLGFNIARTATGGVDLIATLDGMRAQFAGQMGVPKVQDAFQKAFGDEGVKGVTLLMGKIDRMRGALGDLGNSTGTAAAAQKTMEQTGSAAWAKLGNQVDAMKVSVAQSLAPAISALIPRIASATQWVGEFAQHHAGVIKLAGGFAVVVFAILSVLGPLAIVGGTISTVIGGAVRSYALLTTAVQWATAAEWGFVASILANPITWIVVGIIALIAALVLLVVYWDDVAAAAERAWDWIKNTWGAAVDWVKGLWSRMVQAFKAGLAWLREVLVSGFAIAIILALGPVAWIIAAVVLVIRHWSTISAFFGSLWAGIKTSFSAAIGAIWAGMQAVPGLVGSMLTSVVSFLSGLPTVFYNAGVGLFTAMWDGMKSVASGIIGFVVDVLGKIREYLPFSDAKMGPLSNLTASGKAFTTTWADGIQTGIPDMQSTVVGLGEAAGAGLAVPDLRESAAGGPSAPGRLAGNPAADVAARPITIQNLTLNVTAADVGEQNRFVDMIRGLAMEFSPVG